MNDTPLRIRLWADMAMHLDAAQFGLEMDANPTRASVEYVRADLVPQPQEPTPEAVERAAKAMCASDPSLKQWDDMGDMLPDGTVVVSPEIGRNWWRGMARAALRAALTAPA